MDKRAKVVLLKRRKVSGRGGPTIWVDEVSVHVVQNTIREEYAGARKGRDGQIECNVKS